MCVSNEFSQIKPPDFPVVKSVVMRRKNTYVCCLGMEAWIGGDLWMKREREDMCEEETGFVNKLSNDTMLD